MGSLAFSHQFYSFKSLMMQPHASQHFVYGDPALVRLWWRVLRRMQGMCANQRATGEHVLYESEYWTNAFNVELVSAIVAPHIALGVALGGAAQFNWDDNIAAIAAAGVFGDDDASTLAGCGALVRASALRVS